MNEHPDAAPTEAREVYDGPVELARTGFVAVL